MRFFSTARAREMLLASSALVVSAAPAITTGAAFLALGSSRVQAQSAPFVYVPNDASNTVSVIDTATNTLFGGPFPVAGSPASVAVSGDQSFIYVTNFTTNTVTLVDTLANTVVTTVPTGFSPLAAALSADGRTLYVANSGSNTVTVINVATNAVVATIPVGAGPAGVAVSPDGGRLYVANFGSSNVTVINTATNAAITTIPVVGNPIGVAVSPDGTTVYATTSLANTVTPINTTTNTAGVPIAVGAGPRGEVISPDGKTLYVANSSSNNVTVINLTTNTVIATIPAGLNPFGVAVSPDGKSVYVTNASSDNVTVINAATNTVIATLPVGSAPFSPGACSNGNALLASGLTFRANIAGALGCTLASGSGGAAGPVFTGGTMQFIANNITSALPISLQALGGTIDTGVNTATLNGAITGPGGLTKIGAGTLVLGGAGTYAGPTSINAGTLQAGAVNVFSPNSAYTVANGATLALNGLNQTIGSLAGAGAVSLGAAILTTGFDNTSTAFAGAITGSGGVTKVGSGTMTLSGANTYAGLTSVNGGVLAVNGSLAGAVAVNAGGTLGGNGTVGNTTINGGTLSPGNSIGLLTVQGNLMFTAAASYMVEVSPASADRTNVTGAATLGGATVNTNFAAGTYVAKQYTIIHATGGVSGTFSGPVNTNLPSGFTPTLGYDSNNAYLNLALSFVPPPGTGLSGNQQAVGNAIVNFFNTNGGIPLVFGALTPAGLTQLSGEVATGSQQTTFNAMNLFMGVMTDPFTAGRGDPISAGGSPNAYADEGLAYAAKRKPNDALAAIHTKAPPPPVRTFEQRWSVWAAGFGGSQTTDGNAALGSNDTRSSIYAGAVGADYRFSPNTIAGFAMAGGGTNFSVANGGTGRSDLFQAGAFIRHNAGPAYLTGSLAYGWQDITTDRIVTVAGFDQLRAKFNANAWSGRIEGGYRFVSQGFGWTPYAAGQFTTFELPAYAEQAIVGSNAFALGYNSKSVTDTRSELGLRTDKSFAMTNAVLTLRGRAAWAHDYNPDRSIGATFQTLPGASFVVNGARQAADAALVTGSAEMKWINGWSAAATFEGEFSNVTRSYAGKGVVRYQW